MNLSLSLSLYHMAIVGIKGLTNVKFCMLQLELYQA